MGRASIPTLLPIDRWATLLGISPIIWNQMFSENFGATANCGDTWYQHTYQNPEFTSREDIARAINEAEGMIASALGYFPMPNWTVEERKQTVRPEKPELISRGSVNVHNRRDKFLFFFFNFICKGHKRGQIGIFKIF